MSSGTYINCTVSPRPVEALDENAVPWRDLGTGFTDIGFTPSAKVRFVYQVSGATEKRFVTESLGDTDGDGKRILFVSSEGPGPHVIGSDWRDASLPLSLGTREDTGD